MHPLLLLRAFLPRLQPRPPLCILLSRLLLRLLCHPCPRARRSLRRRRRPARLRSRSASSRSPRRSTQRRRQLLHPSVLVLHGGDSSLQRQSRRRPARRDDARADRRLRPCSRGLALILRRRSGLGLGHPEDASCAPDDPLLLLSAIAVFGGGRHEHKRPYWACTRSIRRARLREVEPQWTLRARRRLVREVQLGRRHWPFWPLGTGMWVRGDEVRRGHVDLQPPRFLAHQWPPGPVVVRRGGSDWGDLGRGCPQRPPWWCGFCGGVRRGHRADVLGRTLRAGHTGAGR